MLLTWYKVNIQHKTEIYTQLFQKTLSEEEQNGCKLRLQGNMGSIKSVIILLLKAGADRQPKE